MIILLPSFLGLVLWHSIIQVAAQSEAQRKLFSQEDDSDCHNAVGHPRVLSHPLTR